MSKGLAPDPKQGGGGLKAPPVRWPRACVACWEAAWSAPAHLYLYWLAGEARAAAMRGSPPALHRQGVGMPATRTQRPPHTHLRTRCLQGCRCTPCKPAGVCLYVPACACTYECCAGCVCAAQALLMCLLEVALALRHLHSLGIVHRGEQQQ